MTCPSEPASQQTGPSKPGAEYSPFEGQILTVTQYLPQALQSLSVAKHLPACWLGRGVLARETLKGILSTVLDTSVWQYVFVQ
jgi:hypothetical protein